MGAFTFNNFLSAVKLNGLSESFLPPMILNMSITASVIILFVLLALMVVMHEMLNRMTGEQPG